MNLDFLNWVGSDLFDCIGLGWVDLDLFGLGDVSYNLDRVGLG